MIVRSLVRALDDRLGAAHFIAKALRHAFPDHWSFMLGELAMYCFMFIVLSGTYLTFLFHPSNALVTYMGNALPSLHGRSVSDAFASTLNLSFDVRAGLLIRQAHHWCAIVFTGAIAVHMARIFFTGAFRKPRDINWLVGLTMLLVVLADGFTGYSLPDDALSGTGLRIADSIALGIPYVGDWVAFLFFGGRFPTHEIANRLYPLHILFLPMAIAGLIAIHLSLIWRQKHSQFRGPTRTEKQVVGSPLWPHYALRSVALMLGTFGVLFLLGGMVQINPIWHYGPYVPYQVSSPAQPDWYVGWLDGALRVGPPYEMPFFGHRISALFWPGIVLPLVYFGVLYAWPWIEALVTRDRARHELLQLPYENPLRTAFGVAWLSFGVMLLLAGSDDIQARDLQTSVQGIAWFYRFAVWIVPLMLGGVAWRIARELQARTQAPPPPRVVVSRNAGGGYEEESLTAS